MQYAALALLRLLLFCFSLPLYLHSFYFKSYILVVLTRTRYLVGEMVQSIIKENKFSMQFQLLDETYLYIIIIIFVSSKIKLNKNLISTPKNGMYCAST